MRSRPSHKEYFFGQNPREMVVTVHSPIGKIQHTGYCKYCWSTHGNWWRMHDADYFVDEADRNGDMMLLCGECEYTSRSSNAQNGGS